MRPEEVVWLYLWLVRLANSGTALYGLVVRPNVLKKIACLTVLADTSFVVMALIGYRFKYPIGTYVYTDWHPNSTSVAGMVERSVDPLPPTLTITAIVINLAITILLIFLAIRLYSVYGTLDVRKIAWLKKEVSKE